MDQTNPNVAEIPNPLLHKIRVPGEVHRIPSCGLFYKNGELQEEVKNGEVHIYPMTAIDEITIRSPDLLFSGDAVETVLRNCIPQILKPKQLFAKDVDFLLAAIRKISYGDAYQVEFRHSCKDAKDHSYPISMDKFIKETKSIDPTSLNNVYSVTLDNGQKIRLSPLRYADMIPLMQTVDKQLTPQDRRKFLIETLMNMIQDVDNVTDKDFITEWLNKLPIYWVAKINDALDATAKWGPDFTVKIKCKDCNEIVTVAAPMNPITFFI